MADDTILKVRSSSNASSLASAISHGVYEGKSIVLRAIGAAAINQATKAMAIAQSFVGSKGYSIAFRPGFATVEMPDAKEVTAMTFRVLVL